MKGLSLGKVDFSKRGNFLKESKALRDIGGDTPKSSLPTQPTQDRQLLELPMSAICSNARKPPRRQPELSCPHTSNSSGRNSSSWFAHGMLKMNYRISNKEVGKIYLWEQ